MKDRELWFCRFDDVLYAAWSRPGDAPVQASPVTSVKETVKRVKNSGYNVIQFGIVPPDALGLE